jgi:hypothetical protein
VPRARSLAALAITTCGLVGIGAAPALATGGGVVTSFSSQPSTPTTPGADPKAGGSAPNFVTSISLSSADKAHSVKDVTVTLPPGLLASTSAVPQVCTTLSTNSCPAQSLIGSGTVTANGGSLNPTVGLYLTPAPDGSKDIAGVGAILYLGAVGSNPAANASGPVDVVTSATGQPQLQLHVNNLPNSVSGADIVVNSINLTINGKAADANGVADNGAAFVRLPTNCSAATTTLSVDTYDPATTGTGSDAFTPTSCSSLAYAPKLSGTATKDPSDSGVTVVTDLTQAAGEAASQTATLGIPSNLLQPNVSAAVSQICPTADGCTHPMGTATATTPLLSSPLNGTVYVTGSLGSPALTIVFPAPFAFSLSGAISISGSTVSFTNVPDVPLSDLKVTLPGNGGNGLFESNCSATSGTATGSFTGQNGASAQSNAPISLTGCSAQTGGGGGGTKAGSPTISGSISGLAKGKATIRLKLKAGKNAPKLKSFKVKLASGLSFIKKGIAKGVSVTGGGRAKIKLSGSTLVVTLKSAASTVSVSISSKALKVSKGLQKNAKKHKVKSVKITVPVTDTAGLTTTLTLTVKNPR